MKDNRRVKMTKNCLKQALLELLSANGKDKVNITDVCNAADVNRSTFYAYYNGLDDLMQEVEDDFLAQIPLPLFQMTDDERCLTEVGKIFEYIKSNANVFNILTRDEEFTQKMTRYIFDQYNDQTLADDDSTGRYIIIYRISGAIGLLKHWIVDGFPIPPADFARFVMKIATSTILQ